MLDTLVLARELHPGQRNNLDALCKRYNVDNSGRDLHGALLDARILADVYLAMTGGQAALALTGERSDPVAAHPERPRRVVGPLKVLVASEQEREAHAQALRVIRQASGGRCLWEDPPPPRDA